MYNSYSKGTEAYLQYQEFMSLDSEIEHLSGALGDVAMEACDIIESQEQELADIEKRLSQAEGEVKRLEKELAESSFDKRDLIATLTTLNQAAAAMGKFCLTNIILLGGEVETENPDNGSGDNGASGGETPVSPASREDSS